MRRTLVLMLVGACAHARDPGTYATDVGKLFAGRHDAIQTCYEGVVKATPTAAGRVSIKFGVEPKTGLIVDPKIDSSTAPAPVGQCVIDGIAGLALTPADDKRGEATWVWDFSAKPAGS